MLSYDFKEIMSITGDKGLIENLKAPKYAQDPLIRRLKNHPEQFQVRKI